MIIRFVGLLTVAGFESKLEGSPAKLVGPLDVAETHTQEAVNF